MQTFREEKRIKVLGSFTVDERRRIMTILPTMEGMKKWLKDGGFTFEATPINLEMFARAFPESEVAPPRPPPLPAVLNNQPVIRYVSRREPFGHQKRALLKWGSLPVFAVFMEMGTGKSKLFIDKVGTQWCDRLITGVLIVAKRGKHIDWIDEDIPINLGAMVPWFGWAWNKKPLSPKIFERERLAFFTINVDALKTKPGESAALEFIRAHAGRVHMCIDESQDIKNWGAKRTQVCAALGQLCAFRTIMTGTPIAKNLLDVWSQFKFLDETIIGMRYATTFKAEFCVIDRQSHLIVAAKNVERFYARVDKHLFRVTKEEELDLPPKLWKQHVFEMSDEQRRHYDELKETFMTELDSGEKMTVTHVATMFMRLQQITCGVFTDTEGIVHRLNYNPRLEALREVCEARTGKMAIWARFQSDIEDIMAMLGERAVAYYGKTTDLQRQEAKSLFLNPRSSIDYFVSNAAVVAGLDGLQNVCRTGTFYSNSYNALDRWQAEDRLHRIGTKDNVLYIDLICRNSVDRRILANLRAKKSLSDLALDDIRRVLEAA